jgi:hypothetical protein
MGFLGVPDLFGVAVFSNSGDDCLTIVPEGAQAPDMARVRKMGMIWVNGVYLRVASVDGVSIRVAAEANQRATNGTALFNAGEARERFRVAIEYESRAARFVGRPDAVAAVVVRRVDDAVADLFYAAYHEPTDRLTRLVAFDGVCVEARRDDVRETTTGELLRTVRVPLDRLRRSTLPVPERAGEERRADVNLAFSAVEERAHAHDFSSIARSESEVLDLAHSEARVAAGLFWLKTDRQHYPTGGVLMDRATGFVHATFHNTDGGVVGVARAWMAARGRAGPAGDLALYVTAPCEDDSEEDVAALGRAGVKHFLYAVAPRLAVRCPDRLALVELAPNAPALVALDRFYRAFIYHDNYGGLPHLTWMRTLDITLGLEPSLGRAALLPDRAMDFDLDLGLIEHIAQNAQATITAEPGALGRLRVTYTQGERVLTGRSARGRDGSTDGTDLVDESAAACVRPPLVVDEPRTLQEAQAFLRRLRVVHAVVYEPDAQARWPRLFLNWELIREQALFCVPAATTRARGQARSLYLNKLGANDEGFVYMSGLDWHVGAPPADDDGDDAATVARDVSPLRLICDAGGSVWWVALELGDAPGTRTITTPDKHFEIFLHLMEAGTAPLLARLREKGLGATELTCVAYDTRVGLSAVLRTAVANAANVDLPPLLLLPGNGTLILPHAFPSDTSDQGIFIAGVAAKTTERCSRMLLAPLARDYTSSVALIARAYTIALIELED